VTAIVGGAVYIIYHRAISATIGVLLFVNVCHICNFVLAFEKAVQEANQIPLVLFLAEYDFKTIVGTRVYSSSHEAQFILIISVLLLFWNVLVPILSQK
jgi:hypothetical protein